MLKFFILFSLSWFTLTFLILFSLWLSLIFIFLDLKFFLFLLIILSSFFNGFFIIYIFYLMILNLFKNLFRLLFLFYWLLLNTNWFSFHLINFKSRVVVDNLKLIRRLKLLNFYILLLLLTYRLWDCLSLQLILSIPSLKHNKPSIIFIWSFQ